MSICWSAAAIVQRREPRAGEFARRSSERLTRWYDARMARTVVCVSWPELVEAELRERILRCGDVELVVAPYFEPSELRSAKRDGQALPAALRPLAPKLSEAALEALSRAEVLLALDVPEKLHDLAPRLRWIQGAGAGVGQFGEKELAARGVRLTNAAGIGAVPIAEFVMGRILEHWKLFPEISRLQGEKKWKFAPGRLLAGCTLGIVGLGAIGSEVAKRAKAFEMRVLALRRSARPGDTAPHTDALFGPAALRELLSRSDAVVLSAPDTPETRGMIGAVELAAMKPGALLVNVGRGSAIVESALCEALASGHLGAAALDVADQEPLPPDDPLWSAPNIRISAHSSAGNDGYARRLVAMFSDNLVRYLKGEPLFNLVEPDVGY
jgi:phosphoglycerate dehydrogenase-like enzyme